MIGKVWIVARHRRGRKKHFALRWNEPILDSQGRPVLDKEGKVQYRTVTKLCKTSNRVTAQTLAEKKFGELNGLAPADAKPTDATIEELAALDEQWLRNRGRAEGTAYLSRLALRTFQERRGDARAETAQALDDHGAGCGELRDRPVADARQAGDPWAGRNGLVEEVVRRARIARDRRGNGRAVASVRYGE